MRIGLSILHSVLEIMNNLNNAKSSDICKTSDNLAFYRLQMRSQQWIKTIKHFSKDF